MKNSKHLVLDIETFGTEKGSHIISIGAVCGDDEFYISNILPFALEGKTKPTIDFDTFQWWLTKPCQEARDALYNQQPIMISEALFGLIRFIRKTKPDFFWGNAPDFDFGHIEFWMKDCGITPPWKYWQMRDIRTIRDFVDSTKAEEISAKYTNHIAIEDAKRENEILQEFLKNH